MTTEIDSIEIPAEYVELASQWYDGQADMLYAVASTGNLTRGSIRPADTETDEQWYLQIWRELSSDLRHALKTARRVDHDDLPELEQFAAYVDQTIETLTAEYGLENW